MRLSLVPREGRFYELFGKEAALVSDTLRELNRSLHDGKSAHARLRDLEHDCDDIARDIYNLTNRTFTTPMEPEDILLLAHSLDGIVDLAEETSDKIDLYKASPIPDSARQLGDCLAAAGAALEQAVKNIENSAALPPLLEEIHRLENEGDHLTREALRKLFNGNQQSPADVIKWKDLYDLLEASIDACESVAEIIETIAVKNA
ncbi:MAG: DUF47 family protein [Chloroflexi bacterium]|nr:MAG: DUF47 family protein [Chloroflexota bacterium]